jgi:hypothetical protein
VVAEEASTAAAAEVSTVVAEEVFMVVVKGSMEGEASMAAVGLAAAAFVGAEGKPVCTAVRRLKVTTAVRLLKVGTAVRLPKVGTAAVITTETPTSIET